MKATVPSAYHLFSHIFSLECDSLKQTFQSSNILNTRLIMTREKPSSTKTQDERGVVRIMLPFKKKFSKENQKWLKI
mgnify:FL=1